MILQALGALTQPLLQHIALNGKKAAELFEKQRATDTELQQWLSERAQSLQCHVLPSTSPANASIHFNAKLASWRSVLLGAPLKD